MIHTYQTRLWNDSVLENKTAFQFLQEIAELFGRIERRLFVDLSIHKRSVKTVKKEYQIKYGINARQFNSVRIQVEGKIKSVESLREVRMEELEIKMQSIEKTIETKQKKKETLHKKLVKIKQTHPNFRTLVKQYRNMKWILHHKKRKLVSLQRKLEQLKQDIKHHKIRICFGSKVLFHKQFHLPQNGYHHIKQWKRDWRKKRSSEFMIVGSSDETYGNQNCQFQPIPKDEEETPTAYQLQLTLPPVMQQDLLPHNDSLKKKKKNVCKHLVFQYVSFNRGQHEIIKGSTVKKKGTVHSALTYRFMQQDHKWYVCATVNQDTPTWITLERYGYMGVDFNADRVSVCEIDRNGNPVHWFSVPIKMYDRSSGQIKASISDALKVVVELAKEKQKPIVIEKLSFKQKKGSLGECSKRYARMLSGFAYTVYKELMKSKCKVARIQLLQVNPAYTSQMGMMKFMKRYGMSSHESAACVIARKAFYFKTLSFKGVETLSYPKKWDISQKRFSRWVSLAKHINKELTFKQKIEIFKVM